MRDECAWRVIGRLVGVGGLAVGAFTVASPALAAMWALVALRLLKPVKEELRQASSYRSTGTSDERPYSF